MSGNTTDKSTLRGFLATIQTHCGKPSTAMMELEKTVGSIRLTTGRAMSSSERSWGTPEARGTGFSPIRNSDSLSF
ncbi:MAG: hypothetical protein J0M04_19960 [Verrucomicrobia bacterium]|nr:hypothetical protein [Verrucomicrobiota bacterium]